MNRHQQYFGIKSQEHNNNIQSRKAAHKPKKIKLKISYSYLSVSPVNFCVRDVISTKYVIGYFVSTNCQHCFTGKMHNLYLFLHFFYLTNQILHIKIEDEKKFNTKSSKNKHFLLINIQFHMIFNPKKMMMT